MKPLVYLAGPYSLPEPIENIHRAVKLADELEEWIVPLVPHLSGFWHAISPKPYDHWLAYDIELLRRCDALYRFPGDSSGADAEVEVANREGIPVFYTCSELIAWASKW